MSKPENFVVVHLSATAVYVVIGHVKSINDIQIMGIGEVKNEDFQQGQIKHWERLKGAIKQAIIEAEEMANCRVHSVWLTLSTPELQSANSAGSVTLSSESGIVEVQHIVKALSLAKSNAMPNTHYLMHHCQQGIIIDDQADMVDDAINMYANEVTVMYHLMMMPVASRQNIQKLIQSCDISIDHMLFDAVSTAEYSLMPEERSQGVCLIDIGASTTSLCVYSEDRLVLTHCIADGGNKVTMDISAELGIPMAEAEVLKKRYGTVDIKSIDPGQFVISKGVGPTDEVTVNLLELAEIINARYIELFRQVFQTLYDAGLMDYMHSGVVLSGGGCEIKGMVPFAKRLLNMPVFKTNPHSAITAYHHLNNEESVKRINSRIKDRAYQTAFGALLYSQSDQFKYSEKSSPDALKPNKFFEMKNKLHNLFNKII